MSSASAIEIELRYDYDTSGFFNQPGAKEAIRECADYFENILVDSLDRIDARATGRSQNSWAARPLNPANGVRLNLVDLVVPEDTIIVYLGARDLGGSTTGEASTGISYGGFNSFVDTVMSRGQPGALASPATDYGPWGGSIAFDTKRSNGTTRAWNFSTTDTDGSKTDFVGVALHELGHILGIGFSASFKDLAPMGVFNGAASEEANGGTKPWVDPFQAHWAGSSPGPYISPSYGSFGTPHGAPQRSLMSAVSLVGLPDLAVFTDLDIAGLIDIGWEVVLPPKKMGLEFMPNGDLLITIPTTSNYTYRIQRGTLVTPFVNISGPIPGDGYLAFFPDMNPPPTQGFYRYSVSSSVAASANLTEQVVGPEIYRTGSSFQVPKGCCPCPLDEAESE
ncbi:MAG: hypothetical protein ACON38_07840 [Akkermansiaceae bacterium]